MKAVNLLPERHRPRVATGSRSGSSYFLLGGLAVVLAAVVVYILTLDSINSTKDQIAQAKQDAARDNALADQLGAYGDFAKIKTQRVASVESLAAKRADWELMMRGTARVLPSGVWLTGATASDGSSSDASAGGGSTPAGGGHGASSAPAPGAAQGSGSASQGATLTLQGCAPSQAVVATTLVRLRQLQGATDVELQTSQQQKQGGGGSSGSSGPVSSGAASGGGSSGSSGCGSAFGFSATVAFAPPAPASAPAYLGGGS